MQVQQPIQFKYLEEGKWFLVNYEGEKFLGIILDFQLVFLDIYSLKPYMPKKVIFDQIDLPNQRILSEYIKGETACPLLRNSVTTN